MATMKWAIQVTDTFETGPEAHEVLDALAFQDGYLGGRVLEPAPSRPGWLVQAFFQGEGEPCGWLPDGMRWVVILPAFARRLGLPEVW